MYITAALTLILLTAVLTALNNLGERDLLDHTPVTIENFDSSFAKKCRKCKTNIAGTDIEKAVAWGTNLIDDGQTLGSNGDPHRYSNFEKFKFSLAECNSPTNRLEFPVVKGGYYDGTEDATYKFRAIFVHAKCETDQVEGHPISTYCGTIYRSGKGNSFSGCDVTNK